MADDTRTKDLRPAAENPWYVLMTIAGEQEDREIEPDLHARNRRYWNGWAEAALSDARKAELIAERGFTEADFAPLTGEETAEIRRQLRDRAGTGEIPDPKDEIELSRIAFAKPVRCHNFAFPGDASFLGAAFSGYADFRSSAFLRDANFTNVSFSGGSLFGSAVFSGSAYFHSATFTEQAFFGCAAFFGPVAFWFADFSNYADFGGAVFSGQAAFGSAAFSDQLRFNGAEVRGPFDFHDARLNGPASFKGVRFLAGATPPLLYGAELHEDTDWNVADWPPVPEHPETARYHLRAYERLKLLMSDQKKHADEHMFLRRELACREVVEESPVLRWGYRLFRLSCDSGWDPVRPLGWLAVLWALGWLLIGGFEYHDATHLAWPEGCEAAGTCPEKPPLGLGQAAALSFSNLFGVLGIGRYFMAEELASLNALSEVVSGAQMVAGPVLLFLMALALRNRFRLG